MAILTKKERDEISTMITELFGTGHNWLIKTNMPMFRLIERFKVKWQKQAVRKYKRNNF